MSKIMPKRTLFTSVRFATQGLWYALKSQRNLRIHLGAGLAALALAGWLRVGATEWLIVCLTVTLVLMTELLNTAVEVLVDCISREHRQELMRIKDVAAGAVLLSCVGAIIVGCVVFLPRLMHR